MKDTENEYFFEMETRKHQQAVANGLMRFAKLLLERAEVHDKSKLERPERDLFCKYTPILKGLTYGSPEYKTALEKLGPALSHHYANNKHHPEYNDINGFSFQTLNDPIRSMDLVDVVEMLCDWMAAVQRHADGNIGKSLEINKKRFNMNEQLVQLLANTVGMISEPSHDQD